MNNERVLLVGFAGCNKILRVEEQFGFRFSVVNETGDVLAQGNDIIATVERAGMKASDVATYSPAAPYYRA